MCKSCTLLQFALIKLMNQKQIKLLQTPSFLAQVDTPIYYYKRSKHQIN